MPDLPEAAVTGYSLKPTDPLPTTSNPGPDPSAILAEVQALRADVQALIQHPSIAAAERVALDGADGLLAFAAIVGSVEASLPSNSSLVRWLAVAAAAAGAAGIAVRRLLG